jgi:hypothetical protein
MWAINDAAATITDPCIWPIVGDCDSNETIPDEIVSIAQQAAIEILFAASGRQFGQCTVTYRPCREGCAPVFAETDMWSLLSVRNAGQRSSFELAASDDGYAVSMVCGRCATEECSCVDLESIRLWHRNITEIVEVQIDGVVFDPANYRMWRGQLLRLDGEAWPDCQDFTLENGQVDTWSISYKHGRAVPPGGQLSGGILSCELAKALCNDKTCQLPQRVQTITRQGVSVAFTDPLKFLYEDGMTGIYLVDLWLKNINPNKLQRRARAFRADSPRRARTRVADWDVFGGS